MGENMMNSEVSLFNSELIKFSLVILTSLLLQFIYWIFSQVKKKKNVEAFRSLIFNWIDSLEPKVSKQITNLNEFSSKLKENKTIKLCEINKTELLIYKLLNLELEKYYNTFVVNSKLKDKGKFDREMQLKALNHEVFILTNNFHVLSKLDIVIDEAFKLYKDKIKEVVKRLNSQNDALRFFIQNQDEIISTFQKNATSIEKINDINLMNRVKRDYYDLVKNNRLNEIDFFQKSFIEYYKVEIKEDYEFKDMKYRTSLNEHLNVFINIFNEYKINTEKFSADFKIYSDSIGVSYNNLKDSKKRINDEHKLKKALFIIN